MDAGLVIVLVLVAIIILAALGLLAWSRYTQTSASAYKIRMDANATVLSRLAPHGPHHVTIDSKAFMRISPITESQPTQEPIIQPVQEQSIALDELSPLPDPDLDIARQIVIASIQKPASDNQILPGGKFTSQKVWQKGIKALTDRGWARAGGSGTYPAIGHNLPWLLHQIESEQNLTGSTPLPRSESESRIKLAGNGNGNAARE